MKTGRNFVTTGPLLLFDIGGYGPGDVVRVDAGRKRTANLRAWSSGALGGRLRRIELIRNGIVMRTWEPQQRDDEFSASHEIAEGETAWYIARCFGETDAEVAITNPVYFEGSDYRAPVPAAARVRGSVTGASGEPLEGAMEIVRMDGRTPVKTGEFPIRGGKFEATVPGTARLRATARGYEPELKSIFMDYPPLLGSMLDMTPGQLSDWNTFESIRRMLQNVQINFRLQPDRSRIAAPVQVATSSRSPRSMN
jgi:hypothetical protein